MKTYSIGLLLFLHTAVLYAGTIKADNLLGLPKLSIPGHNSQSAEKLPWVKSYLMINA